MSPLTVFVVFSVYALIQYLLMHIGYLIMQYLYLSTKKGPFLQRFSIKSCQKQGQDPIIKSSITKYYGKLLIYGYLHWYKCGEGKFDALKLNKIRAISRLLHTLDRIKLYEDDDVP